MKAEDKIYVAGHMGLVGSALVRQLLHAGYRNILTRTHAELDLLDQSAVTEFFKSERPDYVFLCAGKTGGIYANDTYRANFIYEHLTIQGNVIHQAFLNEVKKLVYFSCSSAYPKSCPQPMKEEYLLTGELESTSEPFAIAKIAGMKMCESYYRQYGADFVSIIPTNIFGLNQDYAPLNCLLIPALIARFHEAKERGTDKVVVFGTGKPRRDFLFSDDLADAAIFLMQKYSDIAPINVASGEDLSVSFVAETVAKVIGFKGQIVYDESKPEGVPVKLPDISKISNFGWKPKIKFEEGLKVAYKDYLSKV